MEDPLVAWTVRSYGTLTPVDTDSEGERQPSTARTFDGLVGPWSQVRTAQSDSLV
ncbi:hypothetical protein SVIOM74S_02223 [Streptomyces violarus]